MKVCFVIPTLTMGGAERVVNTLANYWSEQEWEVSVVVLDTQLLPPAYSLSSSVRFESLDLFDKPRGYFHKALVTARQVHQLRNIILDIKPQVVIAFIDITILLARLATFRLPVKFIVSERSNPKRSQVNAALKWLNHHIIFRLSDSIVLQTRRVEQYLDSSVQKKIAIIPNPVIAPPPQYVKHASQTSGCKIITIGRLEYPKAHDTLIKAFSKVHSSYPNWKLAIIGKGSLEDELKTLCQNLGVAGSIEWIESTDNVHKFLSQSDIFVLSSRYEGFPNALCEAMACGLAVVTTDCDFGPREVVRDRENGILVPVDDEKKMAQEVMLLIENDTLRKKLGESARDIAQEYSLNTITQRWEDLIRCLINE